MKLDKALKEYTYQIAAYEAKAELTLKAYSRDLKIYSEYLGSIGIEDVENIREKNINDFISILNKRYANASVNRIKTTVRSFHSFLNMKYDIPDPAINVEVTRAAKRLPVYCTEEEIDRLMSQFNDEDPKDLFNHVL
ncbi:MAG: site-specific integrase, partial [Erysipelotrichaceae bacterium]|nr:site-specific integrase [Erysipelotrichaceae bacterium]